MTTTNTYDVKGMTCEHCVNAVSTRSLSRKVRHDDGPSQVISVR